VRIESSRSLVQTFMALPLLQTLDAYYPDFSHWYTNTVTPGVVVGKDTLLVAKDGERLVGVALGKRGATETKLRCVRVLPEYQSSGVGIRLIDRMLAELECEKPPPAPWPKKCCTCTAEPLCNATVFPWTPSTKALTARGGSNTGLTHLRAKSAS
jgi:GNAT superfamily N-acetyltransferase